MGSIKSGKIGPNIGQSTGTAEGHNLGQFKGQRRAHCLVQQKGKILDPQAVHWMDLCWDQHKVHQKVKCWDICKDQCQDICQDICQGQCWDQCKVQPKEPRRVCENPSNTRNSHGSPSSANPLRTQKLHQLLTPLTHHPPHPLIWILMMTHSLTSAPIEVNSKTFVSLANLADVQQDPAEPEHKTPVDSDSNQTLLGTNEAHNDILMTLIGTGFVRIPAVTLPPVWSEVECCCSSWSTTTNLPTG